MLDQDRRAGVGQFEELLAAMVESPTRGGHDFSHTSKVSDAGSWLKQYMPLVEEGTWALLELGESDLFAKPLPKDCVASAFANRELYVVLANYGQSPQQIETAETYVPTDTPSAAPT